MKNRKSLYCEQGEPRATALPPYVAERMMSDKAKKWRERVPVVSESLDQVSLKVCITISPTVLTHTLWKSPEWSVASSQLPVSTWP